SHPSSPLRNERNNPKQAIKRPPPIGRQTPKKVLNLSFPPPVFSFCEPCWNLNVLLYRPSPWALFLSDDYGTATTPFSTHARTETPKRHNYIRNRLIHHRNRRSLLSSIYKFLEGAADTTRIMRTFFLPLLTGTQVL
ncbi:unnamed protein product, partial [Ectocarpus fasciculatus]